MMQRVAWLGAALAVSMLGVVPAVQAEKRVAFVVGTDKYDNLDAKRQLQRAVNDARAVGASLRALGFDLIAAENATRAQFNAQWQKFLDMVGPGDTAAIYYAGHGVEIEGLNFLLPRDIPDIKMGRQEQIKRESLSVAEILLDLRGRKPEIALIILDACRDNPLALDELRSAGGLRGGLAPLKGEPPKGTFIMYSAGAGESALDRLPRGDPDQVNSVFTRKLVPLLGTRGLALHDMARQLRAEVVELAAQVPHAQRPAYYDGVVGKYCLAGCESGARPAEVPTEAQRLSEAADAWGALRNVTAIADFETFAARYWDTAFADLAQVRIQELKKEAEAERRRLAMLQREAARKSAKPGTAGQTLFHMAENQVPIAMVQIVRTAQHTEIHLETQAVVAQVCWYSSGTGSPYLLARGRRYRFLSGDRIASCPKEQNYAAREIMVLRFEPLEAWVPEFSLVEGEGGENQMIDPASSTRRFWNFLRIAVN